MNTLRGKWAIDSNILVYGLVGSSKFNAKIFQLYSQHLGKIGQSIHFYTTQQNIMETYKVLNRVYQVDYKTIQADTQAMLQAFRVEIVQPLPTTLARFDRLITKYSKKNLHLPDVYLAATLIDNNIKRLITSNTKDFSHFNELRLYNPLT